jgi:hypothetical protein
MLSGIGTLQAYEYIYPIALTDQKDSHVILVMHQQPDKKMSVMAYDRATHAKFELLPAFCQPTGVRMLPDSSGFSFIEEDILKIKEFSKRSTQLILFDEPIYSLSLIWWIDATTYYFCAQDEGRYGIYQGTRKGVIDPLIIDHTYDYLYPQKIDNTLFCVRRTPQSQQIISCAYPAIIPIDDDADETKIMSRLARIEERDCGAHLIEPAVMVLYDAGTMPVTFLYMINASRGFYLSHQKTMQKESPLVICSYHEIAYDSTTTRWHEKRLFDFSLPLDIVQFTTERGLVETIYPFLPQYSPDTDTLWYIHVTMLGAEELWHLQHYSCSIGLTQQIYQSKIPLMRPSLWQGHVQVGRLVGSTPTLLEI